MNQIDSATRSDSAGANTPARPSLLAAGTSARADRDSETVSILSSLATLGGETASHSAGSRHTRAALGLLALVAILAAGTWAAYMHSGRDQPADSKPNAIPIPQRAAAQPAVQAAVAPMAATPLPAPAPPQPAVIEEVVPGAIAPPANPLLALAATKSEPTLDAHNTDSAATSHKETDTAVAAGQANPAPHVQPRSDSEARTAVGAKSSQRAPVKHSEARAEVRTNTSPRPSRDGDVALLAHADSRSASGSERIKSSKAAPQPKRAADSLDATKVAVSDTLDAPSSAPPTEPTTAERLLRCQSLNFFASKLCRWRTCFGLSDKDEACSGPAS